MEKQLSELRPGDEGVVVKVTGSPPIRRRILDMGLVRGVRVKVIRRAPLGDPIELLLKGYNLSLRLDEAENIYVEVKS